MDTMRMAMVLRILWLVFRIGFFIISFSIKASLMFKPSLLAVMDEVDQVIIQKFRMHDLQLILSG